MKCKETGDSSYKNLRPFSILAFSLQLLSENKEHIDENKEHIERNIQYLGILIFRRSLKRVSFIEESFLRKVSLIKEITYDFSSFIKENVVSLHPN